jgi:hypothetical protein
MLPESRGLHLNHAELATRPIFGVDLLVVRKAQVERVVHSLFNVKIRRAEYTLSCEWLLVVI